MDYFELVAERSASVEIVEYGRTNQGRPLILAFVSSPDNIKKLDDIRFNNLRRTGLAEGSINPSLDRNIVWLSYGVHGNEAGAWESSANVLYRLANENDQQAKQWLNNSVVILDPCINPDGYNRYVQWYLNVAGNNVNPNTAAREHHEPWPGGRTNHYYFDLNRDWAWASQVETQQRLEIYGDWMPHVHGDFHEQYPDNPYYFAPAAEPYHAYISDWQRSFQHIVGKQNARWFDAEGWLYFTGEEFDLFYPAYGDTYPTFSGAIGMTYEQAGHSIAGRQILISNGDTLFLKDRIAHHTSASLATIQAASENSSQLIEEFGRYFAESRRSPVGKYKTFVIKLDESSINQWERLKKLLDLHDIAYGTLANDINLTAYDYWQFESHPITLKEGDIAISALQPKSVLTQVLLEPESYLSDSLTYDITAWSLLYSYGLRAFATEEALKITSYSEINIEESRLEAKPYAYLFPWTGTDDAEALSYLLRKSVVCRRSSVPFAVADQSFPRGTIVVTRADNADLKQFDELINLFGFEIGTRSIPVYTGFTDIGPDLGSSKLSLVNAPEILVVSGKETSSNSLGQVWHFFEEELAYPITMVDADRLGRIELGKYDCLILPGRYYSSLNEHLMEKLKGWVASGGKIVALGRAVSKFEGEKGFGFGAFEDESLQQAWEEEAIRREMDRRLEPSDQRTRKSVSGWLPGAIIRYELDQSHALSFGLDKQYCSLKTNSQTYEHLKDANNVGYLEDDIRYSGFIGSQVLKRLKNTSGIFVIRHGSGSFVALPENPLYRGFWDRGKLLFANALFL